MGLREVTIDVGELENITASFDEDDLVLPEQGNASLGFEGWESEQFVMGSAPTLPCNICTAPLDTPNTSFCDVGFVAELMESAIPPSLSMSDSTALCDVSFVTELMECDFAHPHHLHDDYVDAMDVHPAVSNVHPHCHHQKTHLFATSTHANDVVIDLDIEHTMFSHLQDACNVHAQAHDCANITALVDDNEGSIHAHAHHCGTLSRAYHGENDETTNVGNVQECHTSLQPGDITGLQIKDSPQKPTSSSEDSDSEDASLGFSPHCDVAAREGTSTLLSGVLSEHHSDTEKVEHFNEDSHEKTQESNLNLLHLLLACAEAVSEDNFEVASVVLSRLQELCCEYGSPLQRLSFYLSDALEARIIPSSKVELLRSLRMPLSPCDMLEAFCVFYNVNPIGRFCHLTLNQLILDNTLSDADVHLVDLHIGYGMQWAAFLYAVALRPCGPPRLRLTGIGPLEEPLMSTGKKLMDVANSLQVPFEYCPIAVQLQELDVGMIRVREEEICAISSLGQLHTLLHKGSDYVDAFLAALKSLNPKVLVLAENDVNHNNPLFLNRFVECLKYYAAVFESLDAALPPTSQARLKMERLLCGRKIGSIVACEGVERVERHEKMQDWMRRLERVGFRNGEITHAAINQAKLLLNIYYPNGYSLTEDGDAFTLRWNGAALMAIGIWH